MGIPKNTGWLTDSNESTVYTGTISTSTSDEKVLTVRNPDGTHEIYRSCGRFITEDDNSATAIMITDAGILTLLFKDDDGCLTANVVDVEKLDTEKQYEVMERIAAALELPLGKSVAESRQ